MHALLQILRPAGLVLAAVVACVASSPDARAAGKDCTVSRQGLGQDIIPPHRINQGVFSRVLLEEVNRLRCLRALPPLVANTPLQAPAAAHADWMAQTGTLSHVSTRPGQDTLSARMHAFGLDFTRATENLARVSRYRIDREGRFRINDATSCSFSTRDGRPIGAHTYRSLARYVVDLWEVSPGHARNLFDTGVTSHGAAVAYDPDGPHCGHYYVTQNFHR